jgi:hypothetical protein
MWLPESHQTTKIQPFSFPFSKGAKMKFVDRFKSIEGVIGVLYHHDTMELEVHHRKGIDRDWLRIMIADKISDANLQMSVSKVTLMEID